MPDHSIILETRAYQLLRTPTGLTLIRLSARKTLTITPAALPTWERDIATLLDNDDPHARARLFDELAQDEFKILERK